MQTVICISIREAMPEQIKVGTRYKIDMSSARGDEDGDWFVNVYSIDGNRIGNLNLKHFKSE